MVTPGFALLSAILTAHESLIGMVLERRYRVLARLGTGGMGTVYLAEHVGLARKLAIKVLREEVSERPDIVARFLREARAASAIDHPNVIEVVDTGTLPNGSAYYVMEYLEGEDLAQTLRREGRLPWPRVRHIALQICDALAAAHDRGIVHRDLKPANCLRIHRPSDPDTIKILDFGIAKLLDSDSGALTGTGELIGTAQYMAPEQAVGDPIDERIDVYALGVMLYQFLTNIHPFAGRTSIETLYALLHRTPQSLRDAAPDADIPDGLEEVVARAMHRDPALRYGSMRNLSAALTAIPFDAVRPPPQSCQVRNSEMPATVANARLPTLAGPSMFATTEFAASQAPQHAEALAPPSEVRPVDVPPVLETMSQPQPARTSRARLFVVLTALAAGTVLAITIWPTTPVQQPSPPEITAPQLTESPETPTSPPMAQPVMSATPPVEPPVEPLPLPTTDAIPVKKTVQSPPRASSPRTTADVQAQLRTIVKQQIKARCHTTFMDETVHIALSIEAKTGKYMRLTVLPPNDLDEVATCITKILRSPKNIIRPFTGSDLVDDDYPIALGPK